MQAISETIIELDEQVDIDDDIDVDSLLANLGRAAAFTSRDDLTRRVLRFAARRA
jgi:hypothetical protein